MTQEETTSINLVLDYLTLQGYEATSSFIRGRSSFLHYDILCKKDGLLDRYLEVKRRRFTTDNFIKYSKEGFIYENTKYQFLKDKMSYYINIINLNGADYIFIWYVGINTKLKFRWEYKSCKKTTDFGNNSYIQKMVSYVYPHNAQIIKFVDGEYTPFNYEQLIKELNDRNYNTNI